jgi:hypothetical protein
MDQQVAFIVGAAVADHLAHALEQVCVHRFFVNVENSSYAAHGGWVILMDLRMGIPFKSTDDPSGECCIF